MLTTESTVPEENYHDFLQRTGLTVSSASLDRFVWENMLGGSSPDECR